MTPSSPEPTTRRTAAIVLAAGLGTRMRSSLPKVLHQLCGRPMIDYVLDAWAEAIAEDQPGASSATRPIVVYSPATAAVREAVEGRADPALQEEPRGTGDAIRAGLDALPGEADEALVLSGDVPLVAGAQLLAVLEQRRLDDAAIALASVFAADPGRLGRVVRSEFGTVERIVEAADASADELESNEINAGLYAFDATWLRRRIGALTASAATGEIYLTDLVRLAREDGRIVSAVGFDDDGTFDGINDRSQLAQAEWALRVRLNEGHMRAGVTMRDPSTVYLDWSVRLAPDVTLEPDVILRGATSIAEGCVIGPSTTVVDSTIGQDCRIWASVVETSVIEDGASVGPFSHLRAGSHIGPGAQIGNYAEIKNTRIGAGVKQHHVSYLGDAEIGDGTNVGAGTITANWDGRVKNRTRVGKGAFLGVDTMLVAPVAVGDGARTGAGAVVTRDVPPGKLAVGVPARIREPKPTAEPGLDATTTDRAGPGR
ncbi:MAG TPA: bifunctional UDP-N-acetylglucosamine diphosphorylase/glucosamine-1-phosphate N-acetyltransferase GlmU [Candidatus Eisenbacteria bacterium]|nr:bifunctional UDP-N-acetylglucosamine diphosphorylase/glucosamine-1-phosphate N-acetyltransferase GlmU [Candidatus Eisenbacteria bacterium]